MAAVAGNQGDGDRAGAAVAHGIVDRLLDDAVEMDRGRGVDRGQPAPLAKPAGDAEEKLRLVGQLLERRGQSGALERHGTEASDQRAGVSDRVIGQPRDQIRLRGFGGVRAPQPVPERGGLAGQAGELLAQAVMQIGSNPLTYGVGDGELAPLAQPFFRHIPIAKGHPQPTLSGDPDGRLGVPIPDHAPGPILDDRYSGSFGRHGKHMVSALLSSYGRGMPTGVPPR